MAPFSIILVGEFCVTIYSYICDIRVKKQGFTTCQDTGNQSLRDAEIKKRLPRTGLCFR